MNLRRTAGPTQGMQSSCVTVSASRLPRSGHLSPPARPGALATERRLAVATDTTALSVCSDNNGAQDCQLAPGAASVLAAVLRFEQLHSWLPLLRPVITSPLASRKECGSSATWSSACQTGIPTSCGVLGCKQDDLCKPFVRRVGHLIGEIMRFGLSGLV